MKPSPIQPNRLKTCPLGDFDMLKSNLTSKTFLSATQTSKLRKTTSFFVLIRSPGYYAQILILVNLILVKFFWFFGHKS